MKVISLSRGKVAFVDDIDYALVNQWKWYSHGRYAVRNVSRLENPKRGRIFMHRLLMNAPNGIFIDHKDGNGLNNQRSNIRFATASQNNWNSSVRKDNASGYKGVHWISTVKRWRASIAVNGVRKQLGQFKDKELAAKAYADAAAKYHGEFMRINP